MVAAWTGATRVFSEASDGLPPWVSSVLGPAGGFVLLLAGFLGLLKWTVERQNKADARADALAAQASADLKEWQVKSTATAEQTAAILRELLADSIRATTQGNEAIRASNEVIRMNAAAYEAHKNAMQTMADAVKRCHGKGNHEAE
jgi:hypothetical protein